MDAVEAVANDVLSDGVEEHKLVPVDRPELRIDEINEEKVILKFICAVKPEVKLGDYKGLPIKKKATRVTQKDIDAEVERLQQRYADMVVKEEGNVESGDTAVIDLKDSRTVLLSTAERQSLIRWRSVPAHSSLASRIS